MAKKTTVPKKTAKLDDKQLDKVQGGASLTQAQAGARYMRPKTKMNGVAW